MISVFTEKFNRVKVWVAEKVRWAEAEMRGKSGKEKRAAVVKKLDELIELPFYVDWVSDIFIGLLVDHVCNALNLLTDGDWDKAANISSEEIAAVAEASEESLTEALRGHETESVDEKLEALYKAYGIKTEGGDITRNFSRSEFSCKCGCGHDRIDGAVVDICQRIRDALGEPVRVNSGCRCPKHNKAVGGVADSYHVQGLAADLSCAGGAARLFKIIKELHGAGKLPRLSYCIKYPTFVHIDCGRARSRVFEVRA